MQKTFHDTLVQFRPTADIKNVLLHEMIHAHNFLVGPRDDGRDGAWCHAIVWLDA